MHNDEHNRRFDNSAWTINPLLKLKKPVKVQIEVRKTPEVIPQREQMRKVLESKNYKPSTGKGVGY